MVKAIARAEADSDGLSYVSVRVRTDFFMYRFGRLDYLAPKLSCNGESYPGPRAAPQVKQSNY